MTDAEIATLVRDRDHHQQCAAALKRDVAELVDKLSRRRDEDLRHLQRGMDALALLARCRPLVRDPALEAAIDAIFQGD